MLGRARIREDLRERLTEPHHEVSLEVWQCQWPEVGIHPIGVVADNLVALTINFNETGDTRTSRFDQIPDLEPFGKRKRRYPQ